MAKNRNKGFSVVEIVIAIAILTLLLTPILKQLTATMRTNRLAKEQQYASESAQYMLEYYKNTSMDVLCDATLNTDLTADVTPVERECDIYAIDGAGNISLLYSDLPYHVYTYDMTSVEVGSRKTEYVRKAVLDDLAIQIMSTPFNAILESTGALADCSYRIAYNLSEADDFTLTDDGSLVQYEAADDSDPDNPVQYVSAIVCRQKGVFSDAGIQNPNEINLGNMHNLDSTQVAMITGTSTNFDEQAERELYSRAMDRMKVDNKEYWDIEITSNDSNHSYLNSYGYVNGLKKLTEIKVDDMTDETGSYYTINVNVYYENSYLATEHDRLEYNVYSQKFYYNPDEPHKCPDIYFEYQPFSINYELGSSVEYSANEYVLIDNNVEDAKLYLYKPKWDMAHRYLYPDGDYSDSDLIMASADIYYQNNYADDPTHLSDTEKVSIHINDANNPADTGYTPMKIYTNLVIEDPDNAGQYIVDVNNINSQFDCEQSDVYNDYFYVKSGTSYVPRSFKPVAFDVSNLMKLDDEETKEDRLFNVTVYMEPVGNLGNTIILNGAKGEN